MIHTSPIKVWYIKSVSMAPKTPNVENMSKNLLNYVIPAKRGETFDFVYREDGYPKTNAMATYEDI